MLSCSIEIPKRIPCVLAGISDTCPLFASSTAENRGRRLGASLNIGRQSRGQVVEQEAHAAGRFQILVHGEPDFQRVLDRVRQHLRRAPACGGRYFPGSRRCRRRHATPRAERGRCRSGSRNPRDAAAAAKSPAPRKEELSRSKPITQWVFKSASERGSPKRAR